MMRVTARQFRAMNVKTKARSKYRNKPVVVDGRRFDSEGEKRRYYRLVEMERAGWITDLQTQVTFEIAPALAYADGTTTKARSYKADFVYKERGTLIIEDYKGFQTPEFKLKRHILKHYLGIDIRITDKNGGAYHVPERGQ